MNSPKARKKPDEFAEITRKLERLAARYARADSFKAAAGLRERQRALMRQALETLTASMLDMAQVLKAMPPLARDAVIDYSRGLICEEELLRRWEESWVNEPGHNGKLE